VIPDVIIELGVGNGLLLGFDWANERWAMVPTKAIAIGMAIYLPILINFMLNSLLKA
jgi:hypothetical protein